MKHGWKFALVLVVLCLPVATPGEEPELGGPARSPACPGDLDSDNDIDIADLAALLSNYGITSGATYEDGDLDEDGDVDLSDLASLLAVYGTTCPTSPMQFDLAGNSLAEYPYFEFVRTFNENATVEVAIDPSLHPELVDQTCDVYVVYSKSTAEWMLDPSLADARPGGPQTVTFAGSTIEENTFVAVNAGDLSGDAGIDLGVGYDVVLDCNQDGQLDGGDVIDGMGKEAGFYEVIDTTQAGPLAVTEILYSGGTWLGQDTYYPTSIGSMGQLPLIVISHGNGHNYQWYDHIGYHMASYGYIVMSHENNTSPGIETASTTTLTNTDYIIGHQSSIGGGVLNGHIDSHRIVWIGHSRGGEGITRAYDRIYDGTYTPTYFTIDDIILLSSMLPTDFLKTNNSNPHSVNYHLWTASADDDVNGSASCDLCQTFHLQDRATAFRGGTIVQGAGHGDFHDGGGSSVASGPCLIGRSNTHLIQKGYFLPLIKYYVEGNIPALDFLWRQWEDLKPIGAPTGTCIVVTNTFHNAAPAGNFVIDDYQSNTSTTVSSSGGTVTYDVQNLTEGRLDDNNTSFTWTASDPMNGMTEDSSEASDDSRGVVFDWTDQDRYYEFEVVPGQHNFTAYRYLSFRAAQGTQHPNTLAEMGDLTFSVTLVDGSGGTSTINIGAYGGGIEQPYARSGGWHNEFETVRILLTDFLADGTGLDLTDVAAVRFDFGPSFGSSEGRLGMDDIELTSDGPPNAFMTVTLPDGTPEYLLPGQTASFLVEVETVNQEYVDGSATLHYRYDGGTFLTSPLVELGPGLFQATLPAPACGDVPEFYVSAEGTQSGVVTDPPGAPASVYTAQIGYLATFYEQTLSTNPGWSTQGQWAYGQPTGGGSHSRDPSSGYTGSNVYGYNLSGDYALSMPVYYLTSTAIDCHNVTSVELSFWRWLGVERNPFDYASVEVSSDGSTWTTVWANPTSTISDAAWTQMTLDISAVADNQATVYIRWGMGPTDDGITYPGWNIDDVRLTGVVCE